MADSDKSVAVLERPASEQQTVAPAREESFEARARAAGVGVTPLKITRFAPAVSWFRTDEELFRVSWRKTRSFSLLGRWQLSWSTEGRGIFKMHPASRVLMPVEGERAASALRTLPEVEEMVVLEERRIDPILAVRVKGQWYEAYRWWKRPVLLPEDSPLFSNRNGS